MLNRVGVYTLGYGDDMSSSGTKIPKSGIRAHTMGSSYCRNVVTSSGCWLILTKLDLLPSREGNSQVLWTTSFWDDLTPLYVGQVSWVSPGFTSDLEGARGC